MDGLNDVKKRLFKKHDNINLVDCLLEEILELQESLNDAKVEINALSMCVERYDDMFCPIIPKCKTVEQDENGLYKRVK